MRLLVEGVGDRVALVPTSSGDVRIVVVDEDDVADVDAVERVPARALRFDPTVVPNDDGAAHDARARRASELDDALIASASMMARVKLSAHCACEVTTATAAWKVDFLNSDTSPRTIVTALLSSTASAPKWRVRCLYRVVAGVNV